MNRDLQYRFKDLTDGGFSRWYDGIQVATASVFSQTSTIREAFRDPGVVEVTLTYNDGSSVTYRDNAHE